MDTTVLTTPRTLAEYLLKARMAGDERPPALIAAEAEGLAPYTTTPHGQDHPTG